MTDDVGMLRSADWSRVTQSVAADLRPGEVLLAVFPALTPADAGGGLAPAELWPLVLIIEHVMLRRRSRRIARSSMFPLAPRMVMALTDRRLLIRAGRHGWQAGRFLGYVSRDRIVQATAPTAGSGWRTVLIYLANEPTVEIKVPGAMAGRLAAVLSGQADEITPA
ncbi:MAG TPA: hypothetical protein VH637_05580 [Streptosporangiaceae bacterium]|jgi:hypothetical protein